MCRQTRSKPDNWTLKPGEFNWNAATIALVGLIGAITGVMSGLLGVGGGFVIVPMLRRYTNVSMHGIVATSLLVIALVSGASVGAAIWRGIVLPYDFCVYFPLRAQQGCYWVGFFRAGFQNSGYNRDLPLY